MALNGWGGVAECLRKQDLKNIECGDIGGNKPKVPFVPKCLDRQIYSLEPQLGSDFFSDVDLHDVRMIASAQTSQKDTPIGGVGFVDVS